MADEQNRYEKFVILVVEDELHTRVLIRNMLRQIGFRSILEAADGRAGLDEVLRGKPHVILCDVHMQPVNGLTFLRLLREAKLQHVRTIPVVFLTADAERDTVIFAKEYHVNGYLLKPVSPADLKARIDTVLKLA
jgi:two-component system chemotaxis response regulator CheY